MTDSLLRRVRPTVVAAPLQRRDLEGAIALCREDPVTAVVPLMHLEAALIGDRAPVSLWGIHDRGKQGLAAVLWAGANLTAIVPEPREEVSEALARVMAARLTPPASLVGETTLTMNLWSRVEPWWGPARDIRPRQVSMVLTRPPTRPADGAPNAVDASPVRVGHSDDFDALLPACVHMFEEEVGYNPLTASRAPYEQRLRSLLAARRAYLQEGMADGVRQVIFKCEVGALGGGVAQLHGVWVHPSLRGRGVARAGLADATDQIRAALAPTVSLYVNDFNTRAIAAYEAVGFTAVGMFATVLL